MVSFMTSMLPFLSKVCPDCPKPAELGHEGTSLPDRMRPRQPPGQHYAPLFESPSPLSQAVRQPDDRGEGISHGIGPDPAVEHVAVLPQQRAHEAQVWGRGEIDGSPEHESGGGAVVRGVVLQAEAVVPEAGVHHLQGGEGQPDRQVDLCAGQAGTGEVSLDQQSNLRLDAGVYELRERDRAGVRIHRHGAGEPPVVRAGDAHLTAHRLAGEPELVADAGLAPLLQSGLLDPVGVPEGEVRVLVGEGIYRGAGALGRKQAPRKALDLRSLRQLLQLPPEEVRQQAVEGVSVLDHGPVAALAEYMQLDAGQALQQV